MTRQRKRARNATPTDSNTGDDNAKCSSCDICDNVVGTGNHLECNTCNGVFHPLCVNITNDVFRVLQPILPSISWVCPACISSIREKRKLLDDQIQSLTTSLSKLEVDHHLLAQKVDGIITKGPTATIIAQPTGTTSFTVQDNSVARDQLRRKRNVIISGFPESQQVSDADSLRELCECHLNYKPWFDDSKCLRIGKSSPRLLRVTLASEQAAAELLYVAKTRLRKSENSSVRTIYFNPDLNPAEARQAFLSRKERRESKQDPVAGAGVVIAGVDGAGVSAGVDIVLNPLAQPFPTTSEGST